MHALYRGGIPVYLQDWLPGPVLRSQRYIKQLIIAIVPAVKFKKIDLHSLLLFI